MKRLIRQWKQWVRNCLRTERDKEEHETDRFWQYKEDEMAIVVYEIGQAIYLGT